MFKKLTIFILLILAILGIYFGAFSAFAKSRSFIRARIALSSTKTIDDFEKSFNEVFAMYSPIGGEEIGKFLGGDTGVAVASEKQSELVSRRLVVFLEPKMLKNDVRHLLIMAGMYEALWRKYGQDEDYLKAENYYKIALAIGPKLPNILYPLLRFYGAKGDKEKIQQISETIIKLWPSDEETKKILERVYKI